MRGGYLTGLVLLLLSHPLLTQTTAVTVRDEPQNLDSVKRDLTHYQSCTESTCYEPQLEHQADIAIGFLKQSVNAAKSGEKLAIVLDIDETSLSNWAVEVHDDFAFIAADLNSCITLRCGKAIAGTLRLFQEAKRDHVAVFFISGRTKGQQVDTEANLKAEGYDHWESLFLRPEDDFQKESVAMFKAHARAMIVSMGYRIALNVGDQISDLVGEPQADHSVKLPNPFYCIPIVPGKPCP
jgi:predicted secreted acid phosphatase